MVQQEQWKKKTILKLFKRSVQKWKVRYLTYVADGDAKIFRELNKAEIYGKDKKVQKLECTKKKAAAKNGGKKTASACFIPLSEEMKEIHKK